MPHEGSQWDAADDDGAACESDSRAINLLNDKNNNIVTFIEGDPGVFMNTNSDTDLPNVVVVSDKGARGNTAVVDHNDGEMSVVVGHAFGTITLDDDAVGGVWNSGEEIPVTLTDADVNRQAMNDEDITVSDPDFTIIPSVKIGNPITLEKVEKVRIGNAEMPFDKDDFSHVLRITPNNNVSDVGTIMFMGVTKGSDLRNILADDFEIARNAQGNPYYSNNTEVPESLFPKNGNNPRLYDCTGNPTVDKLVPKYKPGAFQFVNFDTRSIGDLTSAQLTWKNSVANGSVYLFAVDAEDAEDKAVVEITKVGREVAANTDNDHICDIPDNAPVDLMLTFGNVDLANGTTYPIVVDLFSFGQKGDGVAPADRINNAIYRLELEESGDNTGVFEGTMEYTMLNQINVRDPSTYADLETISDAITMVVHNDMTDEDSVRVNYYDLGADGVATQIADQVEAPTTSGAVSFDADNYKVADTVTVTLEDADMNTAVETIEIYTVVDDVVDNNRDPAYDMVGEPRYGANSAGEAFGRVLDITFDDQQWLNGCMEGDPLLRNKPPIDASIDNGLGSTGFTLIETGADTGIFTGDFQIPLQYCHRTNNNAGQVIEAEVRSTTGVDMEVNYVDYRDASGENIEVGDSAGIRANTGSVSLDRTVYPVPFGVPADYNNIVPQDASIFPIHATGIRTDWPNAGTYLPNGDLTIHVRINDPDFDVSASGEDKIKTTVERNGVSTHGPLKITVSRGASSVIVGTAGAPDANNGRITTLGTTPIITQVPNSDPPRFISEQVTLTEIVSEGASVTRELGPITEIAPDAGIFELDLALRYTDGPAGDQCPTTTAFQPLDGSDGKAPQNRFTDNDATHCIQQGDILTVEYTDPTDASGNPNTVTDSATFDLRNGVLQSDKSVYIIGQDMILTLIEPDLDLESDEAETYDLDLIEWDSDAAGTTMGNRGGGAVFDPRAVRSEGDGRQHWHIPGCRRDPRGA